MTEFLNAVYLFWYDYLRHAADILISAFVIYKLMALVRGTRSVHVLRGILFLLAATVISSVLDFVLIGWILRWFWVAGAVALVIVFQPEIRSFLADLGSGRFTRLIMKGDAEFLEEVIAALKNISRRGQGALIVLEQDTGLRNFIETGITLNAEVSCELIETIFTPLTPLHDGALIISGDRMIAAGCILPLTHNPMMSKVIGTRHRAAVGLSEVSDAIICLVSEESGEFSMAHGGVLKKGLELEEIKKTLVAYYREKVMAKSEKMEH